MEQLKSSIEQAVEKILAEAKSKSTTYGEVEKFIIQSERNAVWKKDSKVEELVHDLALKKLHLEMRMVVIKK